MNLVLAEEELWHPASQQFQDPRQIDDQIHKVLDSAQQLAVVGSRVSLELLENREQLIRHIIQSIENRIHELTSPLVVEVQQTCSQAEQEELRVSRVLHTLVD